ncbi:MAG: adenylate cyclase [Parasphingorhabdus sp.]|jgi:adenylate cyclase
MTETPTPQWDPHNQLFYLDGFEVDAAANCISRDGEIIKLEPRAMSVLCELVLRAGTVVTREELEQTVWKGTVVGYDALNNTVAKLRKAFADTPRNPRIIQTVPKTGYRLIADVIVRTAVEKPISGAISAPDSTTARPPLIRKLTAILYADMVEYSRLTGLDEEGTHHTLRDCLDVMTGLIKSHGGAVVHFAGDAILAEFSTASSALSCAVTIQNILRERSKDHTDEMKMQFRIGVNLGEVIVDRDDIYGDGVNVAARLEALAEPGSVCLSGAVFDAIGHTLPLEYAYLGERKVKNIAKPVRAYQATLRSGATLSVPAQVVVPVPVKSAALSRQPYMLVMAVSALALLFITVWWQPWSNNTEVTNPGVVSSTSPTRPAIAVLPFENMSDDPAQTFYADGMTGDLITDLSKVSGLAVIARHSVYAYENASLPLIQIGEELGVQYILEGNVRRFDNKVRVNVSLIDVSNSRSIWSERYDSELSAIFDLQRQVIDGVVTSLSVKLTDREQNSLAHIPTDNLEAYDYYLRAERRRLLGASSVEESQHGARGEIELYWKAIKLDPNLAQAYVGLARIGFDVWSSDSSQIMPTAAARKLSYDSASKVRELDPQNHMAYAILALLQATDGQHDIALESSNKALQLSPNNAEAIAIHAQVLMYAGQHETALEMMNKAFRLNPRPPEQFYGLLGRALFFTEDFSAAVKAYESLSEYHLRFRHELMMVYAKLGRDNDAHRVLASVLERMSFVNLNYYATRYSHYRRQQDVSRMLIALKKAGVSENAFGYVGNVDARLNTVELQNLKTQVWRGSDSSGDQFIQQFTGEDHVALRNSSSLLVGTAWIESEKLCVKFRSSLFGRNDCGFIYANPQPTSDGKNQYVHVALGNIYKFTVQ